MPLFEDLEQASTKESEMDDLWKGTFREFLRKFETSDHPLMGALCHQRINEMIKSTGVEKSDYFGVERKQYTFFENTLFGLEETIDNLMSYIQSAAQRTETSRRMLLLYGPPSSGKSQLVTLIKRGLEAFTETTAGAIFALADSKMHENPFILVPYKFREEFEKDYGLRIEGSLSPQSQYRLDNEFHGKFMDFPIEQIVLSEAKRIGIGTWLPSDSKSQDISELVGSIDLAKIADIGDESDPRAYNFDGELNVANRGIMEFIEGLKADERFLRSTLTVTQEKSIKAPRFGLIYVDAFIIMHTNESEFESFMSEKKYEAYHDRMWIIPVKYNLGLSNEVKIYRKLLENSDAITDMHIAPNTLEAAAMFAVFSRLNPPNDGEDLTLPKKMKLYDGQDVKGFKTEQVADIKKNYRREGMTGISPRFAIDQICAAISKAKEEERNFITALDVLRQLNKGVKERDTFKPEEKNRLEHYIDMARSEWNDMLRNDIQKAFFLSFESEAKNLFENYLDHIEAACSGKNPRDPVTGDEMELDENLMENIEDQIEISKSGREDFRNEIIRFVAESARKGRKIDYTQHAQLRDAVRKQLFTERQSVIRMTVSSRNPDPDELRRLNDVIDRMSDKQGYSAASANELLKYASAHLFGK